MSVWSWLHVYLSFLFLGFDIAMEHRGETLQSFTFSPAVPEPSTPKPFLIGLSQDDKGRPVYVARVVVNGTAVVPRQVQRRNGKFMAGIIYNKHTHVLDL